MHIGGSLWSPDTAQKLHIFWTELTLLDELQDLPYHQGSMGGGNHLLSPGGIGQQPGHHRDPSGMDTVLRLLKSHEPLVEGIRCHCTEGQQTQGAFRHHTNRHPGVMQEEAELQLSTLFVEFSA